MYKMIKYNRDEEKSKEKHLKLTTLKMDYIENKQKRCIWLLEGNPS